MQPEPILLIDDCHEMPLSEVIGHPDTLNELSAEEIEEIKNLKVGEVWQHDMGTVPIKRIF